jgi:predicted HTH domain antitoxin
MQSSTLHIKIRPEIADGLKMLSKKQDLSVGELVRRAILSSYQLDLLNLNIKQKRAVEAFQGGYISIGKLSEEMGMNIWETQKWLKDHEILQNNSFLDDDVKNA